MSEKPIFQGRVVTLSVEEFLFPNGKSTTLEFVQHVPAAAVVPITHDGRILLIRQFRPVIDQWIWEIPAGLIDPGETPEACARRELEEETGWTCDHIEPINEIFTSSGFSDEKVYLYKAVGLEKGQKCLDENEVIQERFFNRDEVIKMIADREITDAKTLVGLLLVLT